MGLHASLDVFARFRQIYRRILGNMLKDAASTKLHPDTLVGAAALVEVVMKGAIVIIRRRAQVIQVT